MMDAIAHGQPVPCHKRLLITGHPRSGTGYMAALAQACGWDIGHEKMGLDGVSSWMMGPPVWRVPFHREWAHKGRLWYEFDRVVVITRNPVDLIASVAFTESSGTDDRVTSLWWRAAWVPLSLDSDADPVAQAAQSVVGWYAMLRQWWSGAVWMRMEDARERLPVLLGASAATDPGIVNARPHAALTFADIERNCSPWLVRALIESAKEWGYTL